MDQSVHGRPGESWTFLTPLSTQSYPLLSDGQELQFQLYDPTQRQKEGCVWEPSRRFSYALPASTGPGNQTWQQMTLGKTEENYALLRATLSPHLPLGLKISQKGWGKNPRKAKSGPSLSRDRADFWIESCLSAAALVLAETAQ